MIKKIIFLIICLMLTCSQAFYTKANTITIKIDGDAIIPKDVSPEVVDNSLFVPLRLVIEALGENVYWDEETQIVTVMDNPIYTFTHKVKTSYVIELCTGEIIQLSGCSYIKNNRVMIGIDLFSKEMLLRVYWDEKSQVLDIYTCPGSDPNYEGTPVDIWD